MSNGFNSGAPRAKLTGLLQARVFLAEALENDGTKKTMIVVECHGEINILDNVRGEARFVAPSADFRAQLVARLKATKDQEKPVEVPKDDTVDIME